MKVDKAIMSFPLVGYEVVFNSLLTASSEHRIDRIGRKKKKEKEKIQQNLLSVFYDHEKNSLSLKPLSL